MKRPRLWVVSKGGEYYGAIALQQITCANPFSGNPTVGAWQLIIQSADRSQEQPYMFISDSVQQEGITSLVNSLVVDAGEGFTLKEINPTDTHDFPVFMYIAMIEGKPFGTILVCPATVFNAVTQAWECGWMIHYSCASAGTGSYVFSDIREVNDFLALPAYRYKQEAHRWDKVELEEW